MAEVAEKSRAKRAKLDATSATREAKRVKDGEKERVARSARFPDTSRYKESHTGAISGQDAPTLHALVENEGKNHILESTADDAPETSEMLRKAQ